MYKRAHGEPVKETTLPFDGVLGGFEDSFGDLLDSSTSLEQVAVSKCLTRDWTQELTSRETSQR